MARTARRPSARQHHKRRSSRGRSAPLAQMHCNAAGIAVGATEHWVAVPEDRDEEPVRRFGAFTADLYVLAEWLRQCQIETVVGPGHMKVDTFGKRYLHTFLTLK